MSRRAITVAAATVVAGGILSGSAAATPPVGEVIRTDLAKGVTDTPISIAAQGRTAFYVQALLLKPGADSGWHTHPGTELSVINKGPVQLQTAQGCMMTSFAPGQVVFIPPGVAHRVLNHGPDDAEAVATYTLPADSPVRDDAPAACP